MLTADFSFRAAFIKRTNCREPSILDSLLQLQMSSSAPICGNMVNELRKYKRRKPRQYLNSSRITVDCLRAFDSREKQLSLIMLYPKVFAYLSEDLFEAIISDYGKHHELLRLSSLSLFLSRNFAHTRFRALCGTCACTMKKKKTMKM